MGSLTGLTRLCVRRAAGHPCTVLRRSACARSYLGTNQLSGTIPPSMGSLTGLQALCVHRAADRPCTVLRRPACARSDLAVNQLSGTIPFGLGSLTGLTNLCVHRFALRARNSQQAAFTDDPRTFVLSYLSNSGLCGTIPMLKQPDDGALPSCQSVLTCGVNNDATVCRALGDFYNATNGASWLIKTGWSAAAAGTPTDYCSFVGATCNNGVLQGLCVRHFCISGALR